MQQLGPNHVLIGLHSCLDSVNTNMLVTDNKNCIRAFKHAFMRVNIPVVELNGLHGLSTGQTSGRPQKTGGQKSCRSWSSCHMMAACLKLHPQWGYLPSCHHMTDTVGSDCTGSVG